MQDNQFLEAPSNKTRGVSLFERINRLSIMQDFVQPTKIVNLDLLGHDLSPQREQNNNNKEILFPIQENNKIEEIIFSKAKISPPLNSLNEETFNMQDLNENYDVGQQNYFLNKIKKSIKFNEKDKEEIIKEKNEEIDLDFTIQTRKRIRSHIFSKKGTNQVIILSSRKEMQIEGKHFPISNASPELRKSALEVYKSKPMKNRIIGICVSFKVSICSFCGSIVENIQLIIRESQASFSKVYITYENLREIDLSSQKLKYVLLPMSFFQRKWDILMLFCIFYEFFVIPMKISFQFDKSSVFSHFIDFVIFLISCFDILFNIKTGYINIRGVLELNPLLIASRYKAKFIFYDLMASIPIISAIQIYILLEPSSSIINYTRDSLDYVNLILLHKVLRFSRLKRILSRFDENTLYNPAIVRITKSTIGLILLWHWIACFYWFIAFSEGFTLNSWTPNPSFLYQSTFSQYNYSLLWAVTVTAGVGVDIEPLTNIELVFTSIVIVFGVALYGIILGSTSSAFLSMDDQDADLRKQLESLNNFMRKKKVSFDLQKRIEENLKYLWSSQQTLNVSNQWFLDGVHSLLKLELCINLNKQYLDKIPMFKNISFDCLVFLLNLLESRIYLPEEYVICEGSYSQNLYFIQTGILEIIDKRASTRIRLYDGDFFGEKSLFVLKIRKTDVKCLTYSELLIISKVALGEIIRKFPDFSLNLFNYLKNKDVDQIKKSMKSGKKYWLIIYQAYEIAKFLKREDSNLGFESLFFQKQRKVVKEDLNDLKSKVVEAFKLNSFKSN